MTAEERKAILSEDYKDLILDLRIYPQNLQELTSGILQYFAPQGQFAMLYLPSKSYDTRTLMNLLGYRALPKLYGLVSEAALQASGVTQIRRIPNLNLLGKGVLIGIMDTGIDYTNPVFIKSDGTTKIVSLWDQTIESDVSPLPANFGTEYKAEQINQALASSNPLDIVPSRDENGHGTMMAAIAVGNEVVSEGFSGVAPEAELLVIKLRPAKAVMKEIFGVPENVLCYQENMLIWGIGYFSVIARELQRPLVICLGVGTSQGSHEGRSYLAFLLEDFAQHKNASLVTAMGNEGNLGRHYRGIIEKAVGNDTVELTVGDQDKEFSMELWGDTLGIYSMDIQSPSGEYIPRISPALRGYREITFIFERTIIEIFYVTIEPATGDQLIFMRFHDAAPGVWIFKVYGHGDLARGFNVWLPMGNMISTATFFSRPDNYITILSPGTVESSITVTAYNPVGNSLFLNASRGFTRNNVVKPDLAAPGVNYLAPDLNKRFINYTGTGAATAHMAGIVALLYEWGVTRQREISLNTVEIKKYLIRGAERSENVTYPNRDWGYGTVDIFNVFNVLRQEE